jgi:hypothetical protein
MIRLTRASARDGIAEIRHSAEVRYGESLPLVSGVRDIVVFHFPLLSPARIFL